MPAERFIYALADWTVEKREGGWYFSRSATRHSAYFFKRRFDEAASKLLLYIQDHPEFPFSYRFLAACYAHMGRLDEAGAIVARLRAITPLVVPNDLPFAAPRTANCFCPACAWRPARRNEPDPPSRRDPGRQCAKVRFYGMGITGRTSRECRLSTQ
jgi:hypothetical protein